MLYGFTAIYADSEGTLDACADSMAHLVRHKERLTILKPKIEGLPDDHISEPRCLVELSRLSDPVGNLAERKRPPVYALRFHREKEGDHQVAVTLMNLSEANRLMGFPKEGIYQAKEGLEIIERLGDTTEQAILLLLSSSLSCWVQTISLTPQKKPHLVRWSG